MGISSSLRKRIPVRDIAAQRPLATWQQLSGQPRISRFGARFTREGAALGTDASSSTHAVRHDLSSSHRSTIHAQTCVQAQMDSTMNDATETPDASVSAELTDE